MYQYLINAKGHLPWYFQHVSRPGSARIYSDFKRGSSRPLATAVGSLGLSALVYAPHVLAGSSPYLLALHIRSKGAKARSIVNMYNMSNWQKAQYITGLAKPPPGTSRIGTVLWSGVPRRAQALRAARYAKFASRAVPILGTAALAYDLYDVLVNRSLWGVKL